MADDRTDAHTGDEWTEQDMITAEDQSRFPSDTDPTETIPAAATAPAAADNDDADNDDAGPQPAPRRPDGSMLVVAAVTLVIAVAAFVGGLPDLSGVDLRWPLAIGTVLAGLALLAGTLRTRRR